MELKHGTKLRINAIEEYLEDIKGDFKDILKNTDGKLSKENIIIVTQALHNLSNVTKTLNESVAMMESIQIEAPTGRFAKTPDLWKGSDGKAVVEKVTYETYDIPQAVSGAGSANGFKK